LAADRFDVTINGQPRRVLTADFIDHAASADKPIAYGGVRAERSSERPAGRIYVIGIDVASFSIAESRAVIEAAREFIRRLEPEDSVGVYAFPIGPKFRPSTDHGAIMGRIDSVVGSRESLHNSHGLSG